MAKASQTLLQTTKKRWKSRYQQRHTSAPIRSSSTSLSPFYSLFLLIYFLSSVTSRVLASDIPQPSSLSPTAVASTITRTMNDDQGSSNMPTMSTNNNGLEEKNEESSIRFLFSDVDGTLVHYPKDDDMATKNTEADSSTSNNKIIHLPPSSTGMRGVISSNTLSLCDKLRRKHDVKVVLVSGMRTATLLKRLPFLPKADAYASEAGGRIFYPVDLGSSGEMDGYDGIVLHPVTYDGANESDLDPFGLREDMKWRARMEHLDAAGKDGYKGMYNNDSINNDESIVPISDRKGKLWEFAQTLIQKGYVIDTKEYSACFRVNLKQQVDERITDEEFDKLSKMDLPPELASSTNLGCVDFYPNDSGKKNCCAYLVNALRASDQAENLSLSKNAVCMCDDDNDLEMALACSHAYLPGITSSSMARTATENKEKITVTEDTSRGLFETSATDEALRVILNRVKEGAGKMRAG